MESYFEKRSKINFTKIGQADLDFPRRELSNGGLGIVVALLLRWGIIFCVSISDALSSCNNFVSNYHAWCHGKSSTEKKK